MKKTPTIFKRNMANMKEVIALTHPDCDWVFAGEGVATRKYDGTCCLVENGKLFKRREIPKGKKVPENFVLADYDEVTGKTVGWIPVDPQATEDQWYREAFVGDFAEGTYELLGPKIQGNLEKFEKHILLKHSDAEIYPNVPREFNALAEWLKDKDIEGLVFHHPDGRMAKIKKRDFGQHR
jgi:hypothetical protein